MKTKETLKLAEEFDACSEAIEWLKSLDDSVIPWDICDRGDWMLWSANRINVDEKILTRAKCACARLALPFAGENLAVCTSTIETAERWCDGGATEKELAAAAYAAYAAFAAAAHTAAADAASAAAYAAYAAFAAAAHTAAADAAHAAAYAAYADAAHAAFAAAFAAAAAYAADVDAAHAAADAARKRILKHCADEIRKIIPNIDEVMK